VLAEKNTKHTYTTVLSEEKCLPLKLIEAYTICSSNAQKRRLLQPNTRPTGGTDSAPQQGC